MIGDNGRTRETGDAEAHGTARGGRSSEDDEVAVSVKKWTLLDFGAISTLELPNLK
jgi:hypothetical protein